MSVAVTVEMPEDVAAILRAIDGDLSRTALNSLAAESYRLKNLDRRSNYAAAGI